MLNEILRNAYEQEKDICIFLRKDASESEKAAIEAIVEALEDTRNIDVKCVFQEKGGDSEENDLSESICILFDVYSKRDINLQSFSGVQNENIYLLSKYRKDLKRQRDLLVKDLKIPVRNIYEDKFSYSICETIAILLKREDLLNEKSATRLIYGLLKDTNNLKDASQSVLEIVSMLIENGGDYKKAYLEANPKLSIDERKKVSRIYDNLDFVDLGEGKRVAFLTINRKKYKDLISYGITDIEKYIRFLQEIDGIELAFAIVKDTSKSKVKLYFMKPDESKLSALDLDDLASRFGLVRSSLLYAECEYSIPRGKSLANLFNRVLEEIKGQVKLLNIERNSDSTNADKRLKELLKSTNYLSKGIKPEDLRKIASLISAGANYSAVYGNKIPLNLFLMRENELTKRIKPLDDEFAEIFIPNEEYNIISARYGVTDKDILSCITLFNDIDILRAKISIETNHGVKKVLKTFEENMSAKRLLNSAIIAGNDMKVRSDEIKSARQTIFSKLRKLSSKESEITQ